MRPRIGRAALRPPAISDLPTDPPPHVSRAVDRAARRADELWDDERELHFEMDADRHVVVQVRDLDGRVLRTLRPSEALEVLSGRPLPHPRPPLRRWIVP